MAMTLQAWFRRETVAPVEGEFYWSRAGHVAEVLEIGAGGSALVCSGDRFLWVDARGRARRRADDLVAPLMPQLSAGAARRLALTRRAEGARQAARAV